MLRFLSFLLILAGAGALAFGGYQYWQSGQGMSYSTSQPQIEDMAEVSELEAVEAFEAPVIAGAPAPEKTVEALGMGKSFDDDMVGAASTRSVGSAPSDVLASLREVPIAHETPAKAQFGMPFTVSVSIDATGDNTAADALPGTGNVVESTARVSSTVKAALSGEQFDIEAITPDTQLISPLTENVWRWRVTPTAAGTQPLTIELFALIGDQALPVRTFRDEVEVEVTRLGQAIALARSVSPITVVAGGIGSLLAGLFGFFSFFKRR